MTGKHWGKSIGDKKKFGPNYMYFDGHRENFSMSKTKMSESGLDYPRAGHNYHWDIRENHPRPPRTTWPKYHMIIHVLKVLVFFLVFVFLLIVFSNRGCLFSGFVLFVCFWVCFVCWCWGGHAKTFLFEKLHAQFAVLQIARTRA